MATAEASHPTPHGPEEVRKALLAAASRLFAEKGPGAVSVREIAREAGVNHGLVHHYFGSKQELLHAVVRSQAALFMSEALTATSSLRIDEEGFWATRLYEVLSANDAWKVVVRALMDGYEEDLLPPDAPALKMLVETIRQRQEAGDVTDEVDAEVIASMAGSLLWGALVLQPLLQRPPFGAVPRTEVLRQVGVLWRRALRTEGPTSR